MQTLISGSLSQSVVVSPYCHYLFFIHLNWEGKEKTPQLHDKENLQRSLPSLVSFFPLLCSLLLFFHAFRSENHCTYIFLSLLSSVSTLQSVKWQSPSLFPHTVISFPWHFISFSLIVLGIIPLSSVFVPQNWVILFYLLKVIWCL